ncbi:MAG: alpha-ketoacid dehydrogenase subunit beta, partial [Betaproteobacteria bacterium]|nr:alpha-ketoacid dehydrogenase subunit beta [Betaproteobacteria bacterium]
DSRFAGAGAEIAATLTERCFDSLRAAPMRVAALDLPTPYNKRLEEQSIPQPADIAAAARKLLGLAAKENAV